MVQDETPQSKQEAAAILREVADLLELPAWKRLKAVLEAGKTSYYKTVMSSADPYQVMAAREGFKALGKALDWPDVMCRIYAQITHTPTVAEPTDPRIKVMPVPLDLVEGLE